ncbi:MAG: acyloxyacyl hydrolase [Pseudomonadota bacterium]
MRSWHSTLYPILFAGAASVWSGTAPAFDGIVYGVGESRDSIAIFRSGLQLAFGRRWYETERGFVSGFHEVSLNHWWTGEESITGVAYSPVFTYHFVGGARVQPYAEFGIGVGYLSDKTIRFRNLSTRFQFEDRLGVGLTFGKDNAHDLNFRYMHYSNANMKEPNHGIDIFMLSYAYTY